MVQYILNDPDTVNNNYLQVTQKNNKSMLVAVSPGGFIHSFMKDLLCADTARYWGYKIDQDTPLLSRCSQSF